MTTTPNGTVGDPPDNGRPRAWRGAGRVVHVHVPTHLRAYVRGAPHISVAGATLLTLDDVLRAIDRRAPGFRFRVVDERGALRPHFKVYIDRRPTRALSDPVRHGGEVFLAAALSGG
ncbi:MAG: MoaD/ThiS family protein [Planctomycetota bacterium]